MSRRTIRRTSYAVMIAAVAFIPSVLAAQGQGPTIVSVVFNPPTVTGGKPATATITISEPAGNRGFDVGLAINSNVAQLSSSAITIASGQSSATVQVTTSPTATLQLATLTANNKNDSKAGNLTVSPPVIASISVSPNAVNGGDAATGTVTLDAPAPNGGSTVSLASSSASATVPGSVAVPEGQSSATFAVSTTSVSAQATATLTGSTGTASANTTLTLIATTVVAPPPAAPPPAPPAPPPAATPTASITGFSFSMPTKSGGSNSRRVTTDIPAPTQGLIVTYAGTGPYMLGQFREDTIRAGSTLAVRSFSNGRTSTDRPFEVTASLNGTTKTITGTLLGPRFTSLEMPDSAIGGTTGIYLKTYADMTVYDGYVVPATVTSSNPALTFGIPFANGWQYYALRSTPVTQPTRVTVTLTQNERVLTDSIVILPPDPALSTITATPNPGKAGRAITVTATLTVAPYRGPATVRFDVPTPPPGFTYPSSITVPVGATSGSVTVTPPARLITAVNMTLTGVYDGVSKSVTVRIDP